MIVVQTMSKTHVSYVATKFLFYNTLTFPQHFFPIFPDIFHWKNSALSDPKEVLYSIISAWFRIFWIFFPVGFFLLISIKAYPHVRTFFLIYMSKAALTSSGLSLIVYGLII